MFDFTPAQLFASLVISGIGTGLFVYGKRESAFVPLTAGVVLMAEPYVLTSVPSMIAGALVILGGLWAWGRFGG